MPTLEIDGRSVSVEDRVNLIQAAEQLGIEIPHYCYHPGLTVAGNCRMCLVEIENMPKLQIACNTSVAEGMVVRTRSDRVKEAQAAVLEFLLINHPIDCPICDQAGECKLQDYYMDYDRQPSRFPLQAKVKKEKALDIGPLIFLDQERCILCTRCTRFLEEVTKTDELGVFERGDHCLIDLFPNKRLDNPYSGNVADICPVGALTNKDFRFRARVWYLERTASVCPTCATGCNIDIHHRRGEIFRFRPRYNKAVNQYWMCDEGRLSYKKFQGEGRLVQPLMREGEAWVEQQWPEVVNTVIQRCRAVAAEHGPAAVAGVVSAQATNEEMFLFSRLMREGLKGEVAGFSRSPPDAYHDEFLIDADRNPNSAGLGIWALNSGIPDTLLEDARGGKIRALILVRTDLVPSCGRDFVEVLARNVDFLVAIDTQYHPTAAVADLLLPIATFAETDGTFVNRGARVQRIQEAVRPPGQARAGWLVLSELLSAVGIAAVPDAAAGVFAELAASSPSLRHLSLRQLGDLGAPIEVPTRV